MLPLAALLPVSLTPALLGKAGATPAAAVLILSLGFLQFGAEFVWSKSGKAARRLLFASILYLPAVLAVDAIALRVSATYRAPRRIDIFERPSNTRIKPTEIRSSIWT